MSPFRKDFATCALILLLTALTFARTLGNDFVLFDDDAYITANPHVTPGLTLAGLRWAATGVMNSNWHPLTWASHMADVSMFGLAPWGHHLGNVVLHALNAGLLFLLLRRWGIAPWGAFIAALLWAVHPLRVESVAWAAERKDVLSVFFALLSLLAYDAYARRANWRFAVLAFLWLALGLMSKPMLVTLPCVFLLLDVTLYHRFAPSPTRAILEKLPFFALVGTSIAITVWAQRFAIQPPEALSLAQRGEVAAQAYAVYLLKTFVPYPLVPLYPLHAETLSTAYTVIAVIVLAAITLCAVYRWRTNPLITGWFFFLGTLVPVSGLMQVGNQAYADRYTYLPSIGLALILGRALTGCVARFPATRALALAALPLIVVTWLQIGLWQNTETLFTHTLAHTQENSVAHNNLGKYLLEHGRPDEGLAHIQEAVRIAPSNLQARFNLGAALLLKGAYREAVNTFGPLGPYFMYDANFHVNFALALYHAKDSHYATEANNALMLLPPGAPEREQMMQLLAPM